MCMLAILYRVAKNTPILLAANREESLTCPTQFPKIQPGSPKVVCGLDRQAGGTWLGVNQFGVVVVVTNRPKRYVPLEPRSRGLLCRDLLEMRTAREAAEHARKELQAGLYAGANYLCADLANTRAWFMAAIACRLSIWNLACTLWAAAI